MDVLCEGLSAGQTTSTWARKTQWAGGGKRGTGRSQASSRASVLLVVVRVNVDDLSAS